MNGVFEEVAAVPVDADGVVFEHGWQSWSPTTAYRAGQRPFRPFHPVARTMSYRWDVPAPDEEFQGEGLLAVQPAPGAAVHVVATSLAGDVPVAVRGRYADGRLLVRADGPVEHVVDDGPGGLEGALARWADRFAARCGVTAVRPAPAMWVSWYQYFTAVTEADIVENLDAMDALDLPVEVVQVDDGWQAGIGDWQTLSDRFDSLGDLVSRIRDRGRRAGIWVAPFLLGSDSETLRDHPDWAVDGARAGLNWGQKLRVLDVTHPAAAEWLSGVFRWLRSLGIDLFKIDFVYAGALPGRRYDDVPSVEAYRRGLELIRAAIGDAYLLGCGAPILPSVGLVDAMRVSPDVAPTYEPRDGDLCQPSVRAALLSGRGRAFQHGRFWVNDPDCLIVRPEVEGRQQWAGHVERWGGLRASSDRLQDLDDWGLETTRRVLGASPVNPFVG